MGKPYVPVVPNNQKNGTYNTLHQQLNI